jgi:hypothetical protein
MKSLSRVPLHQLTISRENSPASTQIETDHRPPPRRGHRGNGPEPSRIRLRAFIQIQLRNPVQAQALSHLPLCQSVLELPDQMYGKMTGQPLPQKLLLDPSKSQPYAQRITRQQSHMVLLRRPVRMKKLWFTVRAECCKIRQAGCVGCPFPPNSTVNEALSIY